ncbi:hypothetical protein C8Q77DRAFT_1143398 [Trametes polyzona]|nr:hypothetical protein C8Q77DRAFT_1143398 [Trametes polyzona]
MQYSGTYEQHVPPYDHVMVAGYAARTYHAVAAPNPSLESQARRRPPAHQLLSQPSCNAVQRKTLTAQALLEGILSGTAPAIDTFISRDGPVLSIAPPRRFPRGALSKRKAVPPYGPLPEITPTQDPSPRAPPKAKCEIASATTTSSEPGAALSLDTQNPRSHEPAVADLEFKWYAGFGNEGSNRALSLQTGRFARTRRPRSRCGSCLGSSGYRMLGMNLKG